MPPLFGARARAATAFYVAVVAALAVTGFARGTPGPILTAIGLTLPASLLTVPGYYLAYGLLAQFPGATSSVSSASGSCTAAGVCHGTSTGDPAIWFTITTPLIGTLAIAAAAVLNAYALALLMSSLTARRRRGAVRR